MGGIGVQASTIAPTAQVYQGIWTDSDRQGRRLPWRAYFPDPGTSAQVSWIVYSHGLGGDVSAGEVWAQYWAGNGFASVHIQHPGSDRELLNSQGMQGLIKAMNFEQLTARVGDVKYLVDQITGRSRSGEAPWNRLSQYGIGMAGHSFGALTTQALAGQRYAPSYGASDLYEPRIRAAIALSPSLRSADPRLSFANVSIPFLCVTGSEDRVPLLDDLSLRDRLHPFEGMRQEHRYLLVLDGAGHASFGGQLAQNSRDRTPVATRRAQPLVQHISTLFWKAHLSEDAQSLRNLRARIGWDLEKGDLFIAP